MHPVKPHPMQQYDLVPIMKPLVVAQRARLSLQFGQLFMPYFSIFRRPNPRNIMADA